MLYNPYSETERDRFIGEAGCDAADELGAVAAILKALGNPYADDELADAITVAVQEAIDHDDDLIAEQARSVAVENAEWGDPIRALDWLRKRIERAQRRAKVAA